MRSYEDSFLNENLIDNWREFLQKPLPVILNQFSTGCNLKYTNSIVSETLD